MNRAERRAAARRSSTPTTAGSDGGTTSVPKVVIGVIHPGEVSMAHMASIMRAKDNMLQYGMLPGFIERRARSQNVFRARNEIVAAFLSTDCDFLFCVDADMGIPSNTIERLISVAHTEERPIVAGLCFGQADTGFNDDDYSSTFAVFPTIYAWNVNDDGVVESWSTIGEYPRNSVVQLDATGGACLMIHRGPLEKMRAEFGDHWFTPITNPVTRSPWGEDTSFFLRCRDLGIPIHMDTSVKTSHHKGGIYLNEALWDAQRAQHT